MSEELEQLLTKLESAWQLAGKMGTCTMSGVEIKMLVEAMRKYQALMQEVRELVDKSGRWRRAFGHALPEQWWLWMEGLDKKLKALEDDRDGDE